MKLDGVKTALVHDWLTGMRGGERVLEAIFEMYPSPLYTLVHSKNFKSSVIQGQPIITSSIQKLPFADKIYTKLLDLFPRAIEEFDLSGYDLILSTSSSVAKGVLTHANQLHICYMHTPMRYAWDLTFQYLRQSGLDKGPLSWYAKAVLHKTRLWDVASAYRADYLIANSRYIARRIKKVYNREAEVIYPPADTGFFSLETKKDDFYLTASQMVPYKKMDMITRAFAAMPDKKLVIIGKGPDMKKVEEAARGKKNIEIMGYQPGGVLKSMMQKARAFVFAAEEDFGIIPVEAQACGTPVIAFSKGGATETVREGQTGVFFDEQTESSLIGAVSAFEKIYDRFDPAAVRRHAESFSQAAFQEKYRGFVTAKYEKFQNDTGLKSRKGII